MTGSFLSSDTEITLHKCKICCDNVVDKGNYLFRILVNGGWSAWGPWIECRCPGDVLATGKMSTRVCNNPSPSNGGLTCHGSAVKRTKDCVLCPQGNVVVLITFVAQIKLTGLVTKYPFRNKSFGVFFFQS